jgi:exonuclease SbcC
MAEPRLGNLLINNFRSIAGTISIPCDASIVLLHGANGMGKTSVLSALELVLTGEIEHLARADGNYAAHLLHHGTQTGSITLTNTGAKKQADNGPSGSIRIGPSGKSGRPLLSRDSAKFFSERCYLPQSVLGRLLELWQDANPNDKASPLTKFVKDLLGLDQLDALVDGLYPALNVTRIRNLVPEFRRFEVMQESISDIVAKERATEQELSSAIAKARDQLQEQLKALYDANSTAFALLDRPRDLVDMLKREAPEDKRIIELTRSRQEVLSLLQRWRQIPKTSASAEREAKDRAAKNAHDNYQRWLNGPGKELSDLFDTISDLFKHLRSPRTADPQDFQTAALAAVREEQVRIEGLLLQSKAATDRIAVLDQIISSAGARIKEVDTQLQKISGDSGSLAQALANILPHLNGEVCPVCSRDFSERERGPLAAHVSASIATLTKEAAQLRTLTKARADESGRVPVAQREKAALRNQQLSQTALARTTVVKGRLDEAAQILARLSRQAAQGSALLRAHSVAREAAAVARNSDQRLSEIVLEANRWIEQLKGLPLDSFADVGAALLNLSSSIGKQLEELQVSQTNRRYLIGALDVQRERLSLLTTANQRRIAAERQSQALRSTDQIVDSIRNDARRVSNAASTARANIIGRVFNTALNKMWRDLFVRLAPSEKFVPCFKLPEIRRGRIEAQLETTHRGDGNIGGPPGTMLSAGNLNTAALTLFLALHLSVKRQLPWLILDDPVQSMDDVHISQFAALVRMIAKGLDRQIIIAVHDRALFDYLTLELSPAFEGDRLVTIELSKTFDGESIATPKVLTFEPDKAIAA